MSSLFPPSLTITFEAALRDLESKDPRVRAAAADALGSLPPDLADDAESHEVASLGLLSLLADDRYEVRAAAAISLGDLGATRAFDALVDCLQDGHPDVRQMAAIALSRLGDARAFDPLRRCLTTGPADLRFQAAVSLAELDPEKAFDVLVAAVNDPDSEVRESVAAAFSMIGDVRATGWLVDIMTDNRPETRFEAACSLASFGDGRASDTLCEFLRDRLLGFRAIDCLEELGDAAKPAAIDKLVAIMNRVFSSRPIKVRAASALLTLAPDHAARKSAESILLRAARSRRPDLRGLAQEYRDRQQSDNA